MLVKELLKNYPDSSFQMMTPGGFADLMPDQTKKLIDGGCLEVHPGTPEYRSTLDAADLLCQQVESVEWRNGVCYVLTGYSQKSEYSSELQEKTPIMEEGQQGVVMC